VERYLKLFTFLPLPEIQQIMAEHQQDESKRVAQHKLAHEFTELIHGQGAAEQAAREHRALHNKALTMEDIANMATALPGVNAHPRVSKNAQPQNLERQGPASMELPRSVVMERPLSSVLWSAGLAASKSEAQKLINNKGAYIGASLYNKDSSGQMNDSLSYTAITSSAWDMWKKYIVDDKLLVLRTGKWRIKIVTIVPDEEFRSKGLSCPGFETETEEGTAEAKDADNSTTVVTQEVPQAQRGPQIMPDEIGLEHGWDHMTPLHLSRQTAKIIGQEKETTPKLGGRVHYRAPSSSSRETKPIFEGSRESRAAMTSFKENKPVFGGRREYRAPAPGFERNGNGRSGLR
jgi:hypothetical protein